MLSPRAWLSTTTTKIFTHDADAHSSRCTASPNSQAPSAGGATMPQRAWCAARVAAAAIVLALLRASVTRAGNVGPMHTFNGHRSDFYIAHGQGGCSLRGLRRGVFLLKVLWHGASELQRWQVFKL